MDIRDGGRRRDRKYEMHKGWMDDGRAVRRLGPRADDQQLGREPGNPKPRTDRTTDESVSRGPRPGRSECSTQQHSAQAVRQQN